ncbi:MAG: D-2-hydroxyacid dehydrogenase [Deltaproteobacteria bacterium]|nr:D-2-hydroxyacid dehydrogenase [Deltaproteobacteria bacterium]
MPGKSPSTILVMYDIAINDFTLTRQNLERIRQAAPQANVIVVKNKEDWERKVKDLAAQVEVSFGLLPIARYSELPNLRWMQQTFAGADWIFNYPVVIEKDFTLTTASGVHAIPISEHILALMFALARDIPYSITKQHERQWKRRGKVVEIDGSTMGIIGLGKIGEKTAEKAKGVNMRVLATRRNPERPSLYVDQMYGPDGLAEVLSQSDWVVVTAAMTPETNSLIGENELKLMKKSAYIINIARGAVIREQDLIKALQEGRIAGAGLDVFETEPLPEDSPLWDMKNVIITGHYAGFTPFYFDRVIDIFLENLRRYQENEPLMNVVDKKLGY